MRQSNKISGGYSGWVDRRASARSIRPEPPDCGGVSRKLGDRGRGLAGAIGQPGDRSGQLRTDLAGAREWRISAVFAGAAGVVGMASSECDRQRVEPRRFFARVRQIVQLRGRAARAGRGGVGLAGRGGPPFRAPITPRTQPHGLAGNSSTLHHGRACDAVPDRAIRPNLRATITGRGWGVLPLTSTSPARNGSGLGNLDLGGRSAAWGMGAGVSRARGGKLRRAGADVKRAARRG